MDAGGLGQLVNGHRLLVSVLNVAHRVVYLLDAILSRGLIVELGVTRAVVRVEPRGSRLVAVSLLVLG